MISFGKVTNIYEKDDHLYAEAVDIDGSNYTDCLVLVPQGGSVNFPKQHGYPCLIAKYGVHTYVVPLQVAESPVGLVELTHTVVKPGRAEVTTHRATTIRDGLVKFVIAKLRGFVSATMLRLEAYINKHHFVIGNQLKFEIYNQAKLKTHVVTIDPESQNVKVTFGVGPANTKLEIKPEKTKLTVGPAAAGANVEITPSKMEFSLGPKAKITVSNDGINFHTITGSAFEGPQAKILTSQSVVCPIIGSMIQFGNMGLTTKQE